MSRFPQGQKVRGSQKWIQLAANQQTPRYLDGLIANKLGGAKEITWYSPQATDDYSEYRDGAFLDKVGVGSLQEQLKSFWPARGPQWDALGRLGDEILLVEAKAHIDELFSPPSKAGEVSMVKIRQALSETAKSLGAEPLAPWETTFYQLANRLAHLYFLRKNEKKARLVLVNFIGDTDMCGPMTKEEWQAAYRVVWHVLGVSERAPLFQYVDHCFPQVSYLGSVP